MPFATALSSHPVAAEAVGQVLGELVEVGGVEPDAVVLFVSGSHTEFAGEIAAAVHTVLRPRSLVGTTAAAVLGGGREIEAEPGLALWAAWTSPFRSLRLRARPDGEHVAIDGIPADLAIGSTLLLLADPYSFPAPALADELARTRPDLTLVGGLASAASQPGGNTLLLDDELHHDGAVGLVLPERHLVGPVVSQGCRPVGEPMVVTRAEGQFLLELAGRPAYDQLALLIDSLDTDERAMLARGVHIGIVIDESRDRYDRGDFLIRGVLGADKDRGVVAVGDQVPVGATVQFQVRDAASADEDLHHLLTGVHGDSALVFTCNGRGVDLFGTPDHDARVVTERLDTDAVAGMFCAGELGPVGGRSFVHGFTASVVIFADD